MMAYSSGGPMLGGAGGMQQSRPRFRKSWKMLLYQISSPSFYGVKSISKRSACGQSREFYTQVNYEYNYLEPPTVEIQAMVLLVCLQNADGSWNLTPKFSTILGISEADMKAKNPDQGMDISVWATVLAVIWLHHHCQDQREEWELLEGKAISWATSKAGSSLGDFVKAANKLPKSSLNRRDFNM